MPATQSPCPAILRCAHSNAESALRIRHIEQDGPAALAGLQEGDIILAVDDLVRLLNGDRIGKPTELLVLPIGHGLELRAVTPAARP